MVQGYRRKLKRDNDKLLHLMRQTRIISYNVSLPNLKDKFMSIYDFMPLPNDPTKKQIDKMKLKEGKEKEKELKKVIEYWRNKIV